MIKERKIILIIKNKCYSNIKVAFSFPINKFRKTLSNQHTYIMINASNEGICVEL